MTVSWQGKAIDAILDEGSYGLQYWIEFMPLYEAAFGDNGGRGDLGKLLAMYDEQRGTRVEKVEQAGEALKAALAEVDTQWEAQRGYTGRLPGLWQGTAATAALDMLTKQSVLADEDRQHARDAWKVIEPMANSLRQSVGSKADVVLGLLEDSGKGSRAVKIDGKTPEDVKVIVDVHNAREWISGKQAGDLYRIFPALDLSGQFGNLQLDSPLGEKVRNTVNDWLRDPFRRDFDAKLTRYIDACHQTDDHFKQQYQNLANALAAVSDRAYPRPEGPTKPSQDTPGNQNQPGNENQPTPSGPPGTPGTPSPSTVPASTAPSTVPASTVPASTTPATPTMPTTPAPLAPKLPGLDGLAAISQVAGGLSPLASGLAQTVQQGISALSGTIKSGIDDAIEKLKDTIDPKNPAKDGEPKAEFDIAGKHVTFEMGSDGELKLVLSDEAGKQQEFELELNEHGIPVISMNEPKEPAPPADIPAPGTQGKDKPVDATPAPEPSTGQPGVPSGTPPTTRREEDGERWPKPIPEQAEAKPEQGEPQPAAPFDSGAELAEAGPL
ncbi:hypothetical protein [Nocardia amamiensis]|uniref:hypothetical protein n=1 Tax=Nocardia amamiensis TaxID=404578 RepID=UPI000830635C|nr:hypothetical protein [Nocardia amamiensis]